MPIGLHSEVLVPENLPMELLAALMLFAYVTAVIMGLRKLYEELLKRGFAEGRAVYLNRKLIHVFGGGVTSLLVPVLFTSPLIPLLFSLLAAGIMLSYHRRGRLLQWFQVEENTYEANFAVVWGVSLLLLWLLFGTARYAVVPLIFISFGDAVTGFARNLLLGQRSKHWVGTLAMLGVTLPLGAIYAGLVGAAAAAASSLVERLERNPIDDNVLIGLSSTIILVLGGYAGLL
jgi:phytol kinase